MTPLAELVPSLTDAFFRDARAGSAPLTRVTDVRLVLPLEMQIRAGGELFASTPRGRLATGFDVRHGALALRLVERGAEGVRS